MTSRCDDQPIKDQLVGVSFSFYTDAEVERLSVKQIVDPIAFDHLNNPMNAGLHDKALGVSPFDHKSTCPTCGMSVNYCPGHVGHISLTAPIFNPFLFKDAYRLLKAKCFGCHRLRIHASKINVFVIALKLLKAGDLVNSHRLKTFFNSAAKEVTLLNETALTDKKKLFAFKNALEELAPANKAGRKVAEYIRNVENVDLPNFVSKMENAINDKKGEYEEELKEILDSIGKTDIDVAFTSSAQKAILELFKEIWGSVITTVCPHCKHKSPAVKKDGYTKIFVKPLQVKMAQAQRQSAAIKKAEYVDNEELEFEVVTNASTTQPASRKQSGTGSRASSHDPEVESESSEEEFKEGGAQRFITPIEVEDHIQKTWKKEDQLLNLMYGKFSSNAENQSESLGPQQFFLRKVIVPPIRFRPESEGAFGGGGGDRMTDKAFLHTHSAMLMKVIQNNINLSDALVELKKQDAVAKPGSSATQKWIQLQDSVNTFMDASMAGKTQDRAQQGVRQLLERKEGMFRMKMMGKRVNFGGRSVISPDPNITTDQIGVPVFMAKKLTFPESVSAVNAERLAKLICNGAHVHPGANIIDDEETGAQIHLANMSDAERAGLAKQIRVGRKILHRHLANGDVLLVNRQPTLHKPSIMAHICRVLPKEQTIRMHYANCNTYNADFDGDEMNIHLPQSYQAASEAYKLMATHKQYVVPTSGKPIRGLIQDSVIGGVFLSSKDCYLTRDQYMDLVYVGLRELISDKKLARITTMTPAILKPVAMWTGKQVISTVLKNIVLSGLSPKQIKQMKDNKQTCGLNLDGKSRLAAKEWGPLGKEEGEVIIRDNEHLQGTLDKNQFGASEQGLIHCFYEIYGSEKAGELLTSLARIFALFLQTHGMSCGLEDLVIKPEFNKIRRMEIEQGHKNGLIAAAGFAEVATFNIKKSNYSNRVVYQTAKRMDPDIEALNKMAMPEDPFDGKKMVMKPDDPIICKIEEKIGQNEGDKDLLEKEFDGIMKSKMSAASSKILKEIIPAGLVKVFPKNLISAMVLTGAKGGVVNQTQISALLGQQELEGRRVPRMQNGKTLPCFLAYDPNPRASGYVSDRFISGLRPQDFFFHCMAGREGLIDTAVKTSRSGYLQRCLIKQLESLIVNYDLTVRDNDGSIVQFCYGDDGVDVMQTGFLTKFKFLEQNYTSLIQKTERLISSGAVQIEPIEQEKRKIRHNAKRAFKKDPTLSSEAAKQAVSDPLMANFNPLCHFGSISELVEKNLNDFAKKDSLFGQIERQGKNALKRKFQTLDSDKLRQLYYTKYLKSVVNPGENVGTIAAQSIGEPSTQMTLNTFHLAGHGAANMTLGIPRLKEILMTTPTNIKTPCMTLFFNKGHKLSREQLQQFANSFERLRFSDIVHEVRVAQSIDKTTCGRFNRLYKLTLEFEDSKKLKDKLGISFSHLCKIFTDKFVPTLMSEALKNLRKAAETDIGGTGGAENALALKKVIQKTTTVTKVSRGTKEAKLEDENIADENATFNVEPTQQDSEDDKSESGDEIMDIDGATKNKITKYENEESHSEIGSEHVQSEQGGSADASDNEEATEQIDLKNLKKLMREKHSKYLQFIKGDFEFVSGKSVTLTLSFPLEYKKLLVLSLAENTLQKVLVRNVPGIDKCSLVYPKKESDELYMFVQGLNFDQFLQAGHVIDLNRIQTNHSYALKQRFGIEACRANIVKECRAVFDVYGIAVDYRHLSLIADYITFNGDYRAFNRIGMEESSSPFLKMSFETTMKYLVQSSCAQDTDWLTSPSSALVLGQIPRVGTNTFDLIQHQI